jgi:putative membrane protein
MQAPGPQMGGDVQRAPGNTPSTNSQGINQRTSMRDSLGAPGQNGQQILDKEFVRSATQAGLAAIKLSNLALEKGSPDVKALAQKIVDDHSEMNKDLASVADSMGVTLPKRVSNDQQAEYDKLNGLAGKDFDKEYVNYLADTHWQDAHSFRMEASIAVDPGLQAEVLKALGIMHVHLGLIVKTATAEGIALPERPRRPNPATANNTSH